MTNSVLQPQGCIYTLSDPDSLQVRYVGQTIDPDKRYNLHLFHSRNGRARTHKEKWINTLMNAGNKPVMDIIWTGDISLLDEKEIFYIAQFRLQGADLTNATDGGLTTKGRKCSEELKQRFSTMFKGRCLRPPITEAERIATSIRQRGFKMPESAKLKLSQDRKGKPSHWSYNPMPQEIKDKWHAAALALSKPVVAIKDNVIIEYPSTKEAARNLNCTPGDVRRVLQGKRNTSKGYSFKYI